MGNEVTYPWMDLAVSLMDMLQDGKKSTGTDHSLWKVFVSFCDEEGKVINNMRLTISSELSLEI